MPPGNLLSMTSAPWRRQCRDAPFHTGEARPFVFVVELVMQLDIVPMLPRLRDHRSLPFTCDRETLTWSTPAS